MSDSPSRKMPTGAMQVPQSLQPQQFPPCVAGAITRLLEAGPKPAVTLEVMNEVQCSMIAPDLPWKANV